MSRDDDKVGLPPRMEHHPEARSFEIGKLMELARQGRLRLPHFQRAFRWKNQDRIALFDSIDRGYPIGTLLLWKRPASGEGGYLEGAAAAPHEGDVYWIVDGQQRIKTLWDALGRRPESNENALCFVGEDPKAFRFLSPAEASSIGSVPLYVVLDAAELAQWTVENKWPTSQMRKVFELGKRIRQYSVPAYIVDTDSELVLRHIFDRTNSTGKALTRDEVFDAFAGTGFVKGETKSLDRVNERLEDLQFGKFERSLILNAFEALGDHKVGKVALQSISPAQAIEGLDSTTEALRLVIEFLRASAHIPHSLLVPYELPVVVLTRFFHFFPKPSPRNRILLRRWLWRASLSQLLTGASGSLQEHVDDIVANEEHLSVQRLLARSGKSEKNAMDEKRPLSLATANGRLQACALLGLRPRDLKTGELISIDELFSDGIEKAIRPIVADPDREKRSPFVRTIVNRLIHPSIRGLAPARLLAEANDKGALVSHGVSDEALAALRRGDANAFLTSRAQILHEWIPNFFTRHAEWGADDSPPLVALRQGT